MTPNLHIGKSEHKPRWWYDPPWTLTGPVLGVPGARAPFHRGGDEYGRITYCLQIPLLGQLVVASNKPRLLGPEFFESP